MADWRKKKSTPDSTPPIKKTQLADTGTSTSDATRVSWKGRKTQANGGPFWLQGGRKRSIWRGSALFVSVLSIITFAAYLLYIVTRKGDETPCIVVAALDFDAPWMPNGWAFEDSIRMGEFSGSQKRSLISSVKYEGNRADGQWNELLADQLKKAKAGGPGGAEWSWFKRYQALVVYLSAHALVRDNQPCLAFSDQSIVPFEDVLKSILTNQHQSGSHLLIILDTGRQVPDARILGLHHEIDFVTRAKEIVNAQTRAKPAAVLFAADSQQLAWPAPELGGTIFGNFITQGFYGEADTKPNGNGNFHISVQELADYVERNVQDYARNTRDVDQKPILVWCGETKKDFDISYCYPTPRPGRSIGKPDEAKIQLLAQTWDGFDAWRSELLRTNPALVAKVRELLSHADQLLWAGAGGKKSEYSERASEKIASANELMKAPFRRTIETTGTSRFHGTPPQPTFTKPAAIAANATTAASPPPVQKTTFADQARAWLEKPKSEKGEEVEPPVAQGMQEFVGFAWWWLKQNPEHWSREKLAKLERLQPPIEPIPTSQIRQEDALLLQVFSDCQRLKQLWDSPLKDANSQWPNFLQSIDSFEKQFVQRIESDPRVLPAVQPQVDSLQISLRLQRDLLHARTGAQNDTLSANLSNHQRALESEKQKWQILDEFADLLPLMINGTLRIGMANEIQGVMNEYSQVVSGRVKNSEQLGKKLERLKQSYIGHVKSQLNDLAAGKLTPQTLRLIHQHLIHHPVDAVERSKLHQNLLAHYNSFEKTNSQSPSANDATASRIERASEELETTISPELLKSFVALCGPDMEWSAFLKQLVGDQELLDFGDDRAKLTDAAQRTRLCANWRQPRNLQFDAAQWEEETTWQDYLLWRAQTATNDFWNTPLIGEAGQPYFEICAQGFLQEADRLKHSSKIRRNVVREMLEARIKLSRQWTSLLRDGNPKIDKSQKSLAVEWKTLDYPAGEACLIARTRRLGEWQSTMLPHLAVGESLLSLKPKLDEYENGSLEISFRGHIAGLPFDFGKPLPQWTLVNEFLKDKKTTVRLDSEPQPTEIIFTLDCSASFNDDDNAIDFQTAKNALRTALDQIRNRQDLKVAFVVFGHSRNFPEVKAGEVNESWKQLRGSRYMGNRFDSDVVVLEELGAATDAKLKRIEDWLNDLSAFGATPLYYAIEKSKALLDTSFANDSAKIVQRRVMVITDGLNNVIAKTKSGAIAQGPQFQVLTNRTVDDVRRAFTSNAPAQLDVFHVGKDKDKLLDAVVQATNGKYLNPLATTLADSLVDSLEPLEYSVVHKSIRQTDDVAKPLKLKSQVSLRKVNSNVAGDTFELAVTEGRERHKINAIDLTVFQGDNLEVKYNRKLDQFSFPFEGYKDLSNSLAYGLEAWRIKSRPDRMDVRFVLNQHDRTKQTVRPAMVFIEAGEPDKPFFWTSEVVWEPGRPRPTCLATIQDGPQTPDGKPLSARLWVSHSLPKPLAKVAMKDVNTVSKNKMIEVGSAKVSVEGNQSDDLYRLQISVIPNAKERLIVRAPASSEVQQQFFPNGMVTYNYDYKNGKPEGEIEFYEPPTKNDDHWSGTDWIETEQN